MYCGFYMYIYTLRLFFGHITLLMYLCIYDLFALSSRAGRIKSVLGRNSLKCCTFDMSILKAALST